MKQKLVTIETPYAGEHKDVKLVYARRCMRDSLLKGEAPFASHLLYTQEGVLDDDKRKERKIGIKAGLAFAERVDAVVVYVDMGISEGMSQGISNAKRLKIPIECRSLSGDSKKVKKAQKIIASII